MEDCENTPRGSRQCSVRARVRLSVAAPLFPTFAWMILELHHDTINKLHVRG